MKSQPEHHVFGPVPSRRLGRSLGVDLVPFKTCTYDCIYCQLGRTTCQTVERKEWVPLNDVVHELKMRLTSRPDYITLSGSGEPTLYSRLDELIDAIQIMTDIPVAVLTNGSLLWRPEVRAQLANADVVIPSLDAGDEVRFRAINRPHPQISFDRMVDGLVEFRREFRGRYWLEVFLLDGYTAIRAEVEKLAEWAERIQPDKVQLNTCVRPPAEEFAVAVSRERLQRLAKLFTPPAEVIAECPSPPMATGLPPSAQAIIQLLRRRPCTLEDVARGLAMKTGETVKLLATLEAQGRVRCSRHDALLFYRLASSQRLLTPQGNLNRPETSPISKLKEKSI